MNDSQPGPSNIQIPVIKHDTATSEDDSGSIKYADSPESPPVVDVRKASIAAQQQLHDGIILLITSDTESQRSPNGSIAQHPLSEYYLLPLPQDALSGNRRYSLQEKNKQYHPERKASCPDAELGLSPDRGSSSRRGSSCSHRRSSELDIAKDRLTPTSFSSRRSSNASACHSRRSSNCSLHHHRRRSSNCSRRSSNSSRRSSTASHRSSPSHGSRRSSNCSRRSSHFDSDEESFLNHPHHHHHSHRGSRSSLDHRVDVDHQRRGSRKEELDEQEELEMGGIPPRHRKIIIWIIGSVSIFILAMSVVLIAVSLTMSPTIDDLVRKGNEEIYRSMSAGASTSSPTTEGTVVANNTATPSSGTPG